eukprot:GHVT01064874.1.p1 GENE.GHVT01064874.1~~GHVT01064874.1.p1  ORF type:complete len:182 (+),score=4.24 GHVT01064874.1:1551-2096(+)
MDTGATPPGATGLGLARSQLHALFLKIRQHILIRMRPWPDFFALSSFQMPQSATVTERIERNVRQFFVNYLLIFSIIAVSCILVNPVVLLILSVTLAASIYVATRGDFVQIGDNTRLPVKQAQIIIAVAASFLLLIFAGEVMFMIVGLSLAAVLCHACFHVGRSYEVMSSDEDVEARGGFA